ncbi:MAG: 30S ribosomal protein S7, partial [Microgenomates group bacterium GW2011_GWC2_46_7]
FSVKHHFQLILFGQIPYPVRPERRFALACHWMIDAARARKGHSMAEKLAAEIMDAYNNVGGTIKKRDDVHRMADANKAFSHFRW